MFLPYIFLLIKLSNKNKIETEHKLLKQQYNLQAKYVEEIKEQYTKIQKIRHDFSNTLNIIQKLLSDNKKAEAEEYVCEYFKKQKEITRIIVTNNEYVNAMLNLKISEATSKNIEMVVNTISDIGDTDNWDLCNLLGNMLDNAIRACENSSKKYMTLQILRDRNGYFNIIVKNQIENSVLKNNPTLKSDKANALEHGYGVSIIKDIAKKHNGFADFYEKNNFFHCSVIAEF